MPSHVRYAITDGSGNTPAILARIASWIGSQTVDRIQIREKGLPAQEVYALTAKVVAIARPAAVEVLVNERADIALAAGANGVHLPGHTVSPQALRSLGVRLIGVSCHDAEDLLRAEQEGADFAVLAPVFSPLSKVTDSPPLGLDNFRLLAGTVKMPVLALGGVTAANTAACLHAGAAGVAGITLFNACAPRPSTDTATHREPR